MLAITDLIAGIFKPAAELVDELNAVYSRWEELELLRDESK